MRIAAVEHSVPSVKITNDDIFALIRAEHEAVGGGRIEEIERRYKQFLTIAGTQERYFLGSDEKAIDLVLDAGRNALKEAQIEPEDVDFLVYTGVGRGWLEPAMANVVQCELGLRRANCFDVLDACQSWLRGLHIAHTFVRSGQSKVGMIVNCEAGFANLADFAIATPEDLDHRFATYTIGEAATATIVTDEDPEDDFYFKFSSMGEYFDLCMIPLDNIDKFMPEAPDGRYVPHKFFSLSHELIATSIKKIIEAYRADERISSQTYDIAFGHQASEKAANMIIRRIGQPKEIYYSTHSRYGNTVSASVPLGMSLALKEGRLERGHRTLIVVGSAGISVGFASFTF